MLRGAVAEQFHRPLWGTHRVRPKEHAPMGEGFIRLLGIN